MYVDLIRNNTKENITVGNVTTSDYVTINNNAASKTFAFGTDVEIAYGNAAYSSGMVSFYNKIKPSDGYGIVIETDKPFASIFSPYGVLCGFNIESNTEGIEISISYSGNVLNLYVGSEAPSGYEQVNLGNNINLTANNIASRINYYTYSINVKAIALGNCIILENMENNINNPNANALGKIIISGSVASGNYASFNGISYIFGAVEDTSNSYYVTIGNSPSECAANLANSINRSSKEGKVTGTACSDDNIVYIYNLLPGASGNTTISCVGGNISSVSFNNGSSSSITVDSIEQGTILDVYSASSDSYSKGLASLAASIASNNSTYTAYIENDKVYIIARDTGDHNVEVDVFGSNIIGSSISGGYDAQVDKNVTAANLATAITSSGIVDTVSVSDNIVELIGLDVTIESTSNVSYKTASGTDSDPMSWQELLHYVEENTFSTLDIIFLSGSLLNKNPLTFEGVNFSNKKINISSKSLIEYGNGYAIYLDNCTNATINISGKYKSVGSNISALVKVENSLQTSINVKNVEYTMNCKGTYLLETYNCKLNSTLNVYNSTHTISSSLSGSINGIYKLSGNIVATSKYNVFCKKSTFSKQAAYAYIVGEGCTLVSNDVYGRMLSNIGTTLSSFDSQIVCDCDNGYEYSLNLLSDSPALAFDWGSCEPDIDGNERGLTTQYGITTATVSLATGQSYIPVSPKDYITIGNYKEYLVDADSSYSVKDLVELIADKFSYLTPINIVITGTDKFNIVGEIYNFYTTLGNNISTTNYIEGSSTSHSSVNVIDAGSRQKHTTVDKEYYVDLSTQSIGSGTKSNPFTLAQMQNNIGASFPLFGSITYILSETNSSEQDIDLSIAFSDSPSYIPNGYGTIHLKGNELGIKYVPVLKSRIITGFTGSMTISIENMILTSASTCIIGDEEYSGSIIKVINSIIKSSTNSVVIANNSKLFLVESTIVKDIDSTIGITSLSRVKTSGCVYSVGNNAISITNTKLNTTCLYYNYFVGTNVSVTATTKNEYGNNYNGIQCLVDPYNSEMNISNFTLITNSSASEFIPSVESLRSLDYSYYDIGGRLRADEKNKVTLDCGACEYNTINPAAKIIYVNLALTESAGNGSLVPTSLEDAYQVINNMGNINIPVEIYLSGYGINKPCLTIDNDFTDSGSISFYCEPGTTIDGEKLVYATGKNVTINICSMSIRESSTIIYSSDLNSTINISSCLLISGEDTAIDCNGTVNIFGSTMVTSTGTIVKNNGVTLLVGNVFGKTTSGVGVELTGTSTIIENSSMNCTDIGTPYSSLLDLTNMTSDKIKYSDYKLLVTTTEVVINNIPESTLELGNSLGWNEDIKGDSRLLEAGNIINPGCYDSTASSVRNFYSDIPNGQFAKITSEGSSLITRMLLGKLKFKISGYALDMGGYDYENPVNSLPINEEVQRRTAVITVTDNNFSSGDSIYIGSTEFICEEDFYKKSSIMLTRNSIIEAINYKSSVVFASIGSDDYTINITCISPGKIYNSLLIGGSHITVEYGTDVADTPYTIKKALPVDGIRTFTDVEYLPLAISLFYRIEREEWNGGIGQSIVYATITESEYESEVDTNVPFAIVRHGLVTKDKGTILVNRIIIQI